VRAFVVTTILVIAILLAGFAVAGSIFVTFRSTIVPMANGYLEYDRWTQRTVACKFPDGANWAVSPPTASREERPMPSGSRQESWPMFFGASNKSSRAAPPEKEASNPRPRCVELD
jgi:hypothetical protein